MVDPCIELIDFSLSCEWSNISTMIIELTIAAIMAIGLSIFFYRRQEYQRKKIDQLFLHQQMLKYKRHEQITENISNILNNLKRYFERMNEKVELYYTNPAQDKDWILSSIKDYFTQIENDSKNMSGFLSKYLQDIDIRLEQEIQQYLKMITTINFKKYKHKQFMKKSQEIIKNTDRLIDLNKQISDEYKQNEFWGKDFESATDKTSLSKIHKLEKEKKEQENKLTKLDFTYWYKDQFSHTDNLKKKYDLQKKLILDKITEIDNEIERLKSEE